MTASKKTVEHRECAVCWESHDTNHKCNRCPGCGYTKRDARIHMDHRLCKRYPYFPDEHKP